MRVVFEVQMSAVRLAHVNHRRRGSLSIHIMQEVNQELIGSVSGDLVSVSKYLEVAEAADQTLNVCIIFFSDCFLMQFSDLSEREQDVR